VERFLQFVDRLNEKQGRIFSFLILVATLQICYELTLRYFFNAPTSWGLELSEYLCAATYVMGGAYTHKMDAHIRVDVLYMRWSPRTKALFDIYAAELMLIFFCVVLIWQSGVWTWEAITRGTTSGSIWDPPIWPMRFLVFLSGIFLLLQSIAKIIRSAQLIRKEKRPQ